MTLARRAECDAGRKRVEMQLTWDTVLSVLRDPLFALGSSVVLALLASRVLQGFFRFCVLAGIAAFFIYSAARYSAVSAIVVALVYLVLALVVGLVVLGVAAVGAVVFLYRHAEAREIASPRVDAQRLHLPSRPTGSGPAGSADEELQDAATALMVLAQRLNEVLEQVFDLDDRAGVPAQVGQAVHAFFGGLRPYLPEVRRIDAHVHDEIRRLIASMQQADIDPTALVRLLDPGFVPTAQDWRLLLDDGGGDDDTSLLLVLRLALLHRRWREFATIYYRCGFALRLLVDFDG